MPDALQSVMPPRSQRIQMAPRSPFSRMCDELSTVLVPALREAGFRPPPEPFSRHRVSYEFTRRTPGGIHVIEILFDKYRRPLFWAQIYVAPPSGLQPLVEGGGALTIGSVSSARRRWPFPVRPFRAAPGRLGRLLGRDPCIEESVASFLALLPEIEGWWVDQRPAPHITVGTLTYPGVRIGG